MSDFRDKLEPYLNTRVQVRGIYATWDDDWKTGIRQTGRACIANPEINAEVVCPHVWAVDAPNWQEHKDGVGLQVAFDAVVKKYTDRTGKTNYCLSCPSNPTFLNEPIALRIPDPPKDEAKEYATEPEPKDSASSKSDGTLKTIRHVKTFAKTCGSFDKAIKMVEALPTLPMPELLAYLNVLKE